jgi:predicted DNA-binding transcriptional regulator YafY
VSIRRFAEDHGVSDRTVQRDLAIFRKLGHKTEVEEIRTEIGGPREWVHRRPKRQPPVFT